MDEVLKYITNPYWWFAMSVTTIILNLISYFLNPKIDSYLTKHRLLKHELSLKNDQLSIDILKRIATDTEFRVAQRQNEIRYYQIAIIDIILSLFFLIMGFVTSHFITLLHFLPIFKVIPFFIFLCCTTFLSINYYRSFLKNTRLARRIAFDLNWILEHDVTEYDYIDVINNNEK